MPYVLSGMVRPDLPGFWGEGATYSTQSIYDLDAANPQHPPVNYDSHTLKPHSLCHMDAPAHMIPSGKTVEAFFSPEGMSRLFGKALVVKMQKPNWQPVEGMKDHVVWRITREELQREIRRVGGDIHPEKILITVDNHSIQQALVLNEEAARWLTSNPKFNAFGTSWKSADFQPAFRERPIHKIIFSQAVIYECLQLQNVPEGTYFMSAFPLPLVGASESPVCPVLFTAEELKIS